MPYIKLLSGKKFKKRKVSDYLILILKVLILLLYFKPPLKISIFEGIFNIPSNPLLFELYVLETNIQNIIFTISY